jgi:hypothetical protein
MKPEPVLRTIQFEAKTLLKTEYVFYSLAFFVPFLISSPQLLVGTTVNTLLFLTAAKLERKQLFLMATLPSIAAISRNLVFGGNTSYLLYFLPFIWVGNLLLMFTYLKTDKLPGIVRVILASVFKGLFLFGIAYAFVQLQMVPKIFLTAMGIVQLATALVGGAVALGYFKIWDRKL